MPSPLRPVLDLEEALALLESISDPGDPRRGPARQRAVNATRHLPVGSLTPQRARQFEASLRREVGDGVDIPALSTATPAPEIGTSYWLSSHDAHGGVLRVRLERLGAAQRPWEHFWPGGPADPDAQRAAERSREHAASLVSFRPLAPLRGWHRIVVPGGPTEVPRVEGGSLGAALALMLLSTWLDAPLDPTCAVTGDLDEEGRLTLPETARSSVGVKLRAVARERASIRVLYCPAGFEAGLQVEGVDLRPVDTLADLAPLFGLDLTRPVRPATLPEWIEAIEEARWLDRARAASVPLLHERLEALHAAWSRIARGLGEGDPPWAVRIARLELTALLASYRGHRGDPSAADLVQDLEELLENTAQYPPALTARVRNILASLLIDLDRFEAAGYQIRGAADDAARANDALEAARIASTHGRIAAHARADEEALGLLDRALALFERAAPWEANICRCYRIGVLARLARLDDARVALDEACAANENEPGMSAGWREANAVFLAYEGLKLALAAGDDPRAALDHVIDNLPAAGGVWPLAGICARAVEALVYLEDLEAAQQWRTRLAMLAAVSTSPAAAHQLGRASASLLIPRLRSGASLENDTDAVTVRAWLEAQDAPKTLESFHAGGPVAAEALTTLLARGVY